MPLPFASADEPDVISQLSGRRFALQSSAWDEATTENPKPAAILEIGGNGVFKRKEVGDMDEAWIAIVVGHKPEASGGKSRAGNASPNHSPQFDIDEDQLPVGARTLAALAVDFLRRP